MTKRITMLSPISGGSAYGLLTPAGSPYTVDDPLAADLVNRRDAVYTDPQVPSSVYGAFIAYMTSAQFAQLVVGTAGVTYEITDLVGRPHYRWNGAAFVVIGGGAGSGGVVEAANLAAFPATGDAAYLYAALDTQKLYIWTGSAYVEASALPTNAQSLATVLIGLSTASAVDVTAADTILAAFGKLQAKWNAILATIRAAILTGIDVTTTGAVSAADSVMGAIGKLQATKATVYAPVALTGATTLNRAAHGNRKITFNGASANLTIDAEATGNWLADDGVEVSTLTGSAGNPTLITPDGKSITGSPTKNIGADRKGVDSWTVGTTDPAAGLGGVASNLTSIASAPFRMVGPRTLGDNQMAGLGMIPPGVLDTCTYGTPLVTDGSFGQWLRNRHVSVATAINHAMGYVIGSTSALLRLDSSGTPHGGFPVRIPFSVGHVMGTGMRVFAGISQNPASTDYNSEPSARPSIDCFFVGADATDANLYWAWNDNVSTPTKITCGANFPKAIDTPYVLVVDHVGGVLQGTLINLATGNVLTQVQNDANVPRTTVTYAVQTFGGTGTDGTTAGICFDIGIITLGGPANTIGT